MFFIFDEVLRFYVDLNRDAVFSRLTRSSTCSPVTCKVTDPCGGAGVDRRGGGGDCEGFHSGSALLNNKGAALNCLVSAFLLLQRMASLRKPPVSSPSYVLPSGGWGAGRDDPFQKCSGLEVSELLVQMERLCVHLKQRHKEALLCGSQVRRFRGFERIELNN